MKIKELVMRKDYLQVNIMVNLVLVLINQHVPSSLRSLLSKTLERENKAAQKIFSNGFLKLIKVG